LHLNLGHFVGFVLVCAVLVYFIFPLWWDNYRTASEAPSPGLEAEGWTPKLHLNLEIFFLFFTLFLKIYIYIYIFIYLFLVFIFFLFSILSLSL
jgi:hypothetical protein